MTHIATVTAELELRLVVPGGPSLPVARRSAPTPPPTPGPCAWPSGRGGEGDGVVEWLFARQLLTDGVAGAVGEGDVRVWPAVDGDDRVVHLAMASPSGSALFEIDRDDARGVPAADLPGRADRQRERTSSTSTPSSRVLLGDAEVHPRQVARRGLRRPAPRTPRAPPARRTGPGGRPAPGQSSAVQAATQRCRGPYAATGAARSQASSSAASSACTGSPGTLWWMSALGSRSASRPGPAPGAAGAPPARGSAGPSASSATQAARRPTSSQVPSTSSPPGARPAQQRLPGLAPAAPRRTAGGR